MDQQTPEAKRARFIRLAEARTEAVLERLRILGNCANAQAYDWTEDDLRQIFGAIRGELERLELRFQDKFRSRARFHLMASVSEQPSAWAHVPLKPEDRAWDSGDPEQSVGAKPALTCTQHGGVNESTPDLDGSRVQRIPVLGHERSQVEVRLTTAPGWYVRAKDKGHRLGYVLHLFGPDAVERRRCDTARGAKRDDAVRLAAQILDEAFNNEGGVQLAFTAV